MVLGNCFFRHELLESLLDSITVEDAQFNSESRARSCLFGRIGGNHEEIYTNSRFSSFAV